MRNTDFYILAFNSTHHAIAAEKYLSQSIPVTIMPTLRSISASCGISIRVECECYEQLVELLKNNQKIKTTCLFYSVSADNAKQIAME